VWLSGRLGEIYLIPIQIGRSGLSILTRRVGQSVLGEGVRVILLIERQVSSSPVTGKSLLGSPGINPFLRDAARKVVTSAVVLLEVI